MDYGASGRVSVTLNSEPIGEPTRLAICQYEDEDDCYLFYCSAEWLVLGVGHYGSLSAAPRAAEDTYPDISSRWTASD